jgi:hypothetical protein
MRKAGTFLLIAALALAAFYLGTRYRVDPASPAVDPAAAAKTEAANSAKPESQPTRTFRGPDGRPHRINYDPAATIDDYDPALMREAVLADMRNHPQNIVDSYDIPLADIEAIVAGRKPYPDALLPGPRPPPAAAPASTPGSAPEPPAN